MQNKTPGYAVILARRDERDPLTLAKALAAARQTPVQDQMMAAKSGWGILAESVSEEEAQTLLQALRQAGVESVVCPSSSLVQLPAVEPAATWPSLAASQPVLIAAAGITTTSTTTKTVKEGPNAGQKILSTAILLGTGLPIKIGGRQRTVEKTQQHSDLVFYLDLVYQNPERRLRIDAHHFDYSFLKERKLYQVLGNFKLLVEDLVKAAPGAWINHGTKVLLEGKPIQTMGYKSLTDLERECRWLLTLRARENGV